MGNSTLTQEEVKAVLDAIRETAKTVDIPQGKSHWGNTDFGRLLAAGGAIFAICMGVAALLVSTAYLLGVLRS